MHPYLQKLLDQGWVSYHKYQFLERDRWSKRLRSNDQDTKQNRYIKQRQNLEKQIVKITSFLPADTALKYRMRILRGGFDETTSFCKVAGCQKLRKINHAVGIMLYKTCGLKDKAHKDFNHIISSTARKRVWAGRDQDTRDLIQTRKEETYFKKYGIANPKQAHYNLENLKKLNKEYFKENFITEEGYVMIEEFGGFLNCSGPNAFLYCHEHDIEYVVRPLGGYNPNLPGILYYIKDITNGYYKIGITNFSVEKRYGPKFRETEIIKTWFFEDGSDAHELEQFLHSELSECRLLNENFEGYGPTEFFSKDVLKLDTQNEGSTKS